MIHPNASDTMTVRSVFVIGPDNKVKLTLTYPASTGRNFDELLRVIDSLQLTAKHKVATPADWKNGEDVIIVPAVSDEDAKAAFPDGWDAKKPYLRVVKQPDLTGDPRLRGHAHRRARRPAASSTSASPSSPGGPPASAMRVAASASPRADAAVALGEADERLGRRGPRWRRRRRCTWSKAAVAAAPSPRRASARPRAMPAVMRSR